MGAEAPDWGEFGPTDGRSERGGLAEAARCTGKDSAGHIPRGLYLPQGVSNQLPASMPHSSWGRDSAPCLVWMAGRLASGGRRKNRCSPVGAQLCTHLGWVNLQWRSQGTRHGDPTYFPAVIREPWALQSLGHVRVCLGPAFSCGLGIADVARSVEHPNDQINTRPWEGCSGRNRSHRQGSRGGTPTPDHAPAPWPHRDTEKFCLTQLKIRSGDCRGRCRLLGEEAGQQGKGPTQRLVLVLPAAQPGFTHRTHIHKRCTADPFVFQVSPGHSPPGPSFFPHPGQR